MVMVGIGDGMCQIVNTMPGNRRCLPNISESFTISISVSPGYCFCSYILNFSTCLLSTQRCHQNSGIKLFCVCSIEVRLPVGAPAQPLVSPKCHLKLYGNTLLHSCKLHLTQRCSCIRSSLLWLTLVFYFGFVFGKGGSE